MEENREIIESKIPDWPVWGEKEYEALCMAVDDGIWGTLGPRVTAFAERFARYIEVKHGILVSSGTAALEIILRGLGVGAGDEVIVPAYTFAATISAVAMTGATPVLADIHSDTCNLNAVSVRARMYRADQSGYSSTFGREPL